MLYVGQTMDSPGDMAHQVGVWNSSSHPNSYLQEVLASRDVIFTETVCVN